jgi:hypothetical protein
MRKREADKKHRVGLAGTDPAVAEATDRAAPERNVAENQAFAAIAQNLRRLAKLVARPPPAADPGVA